MLETDFILMLTTGFLLAPETAKEKMTADFGTVYQINEIKTPGRVSIGAVTGSGPIAWKHWIDRVREKEIRAVSVTYVPYERSGLATHIAAAFAGVVSYLLEAETGQGKEAWYLNAASSRPWAIDGTRFAGFIGAQPDNRFLWDRIHFLVNESNGLNNRPVVPAGETAAYLSSNAGNAVFDSIGDNLFSEMQIECAIHDTALHFTAAYDAFFDPPFEDSALFAAAAGKEPVYFYPLRDITVAELKQIMSVQSFAEDIRPALNRSLEKEPPEALNGMNDADLIMQSGTNEQVQTLGRLVCRQIADFCQENETLPVLPASLTEAFGPDETDQRRARARGHTDKFRRLKPLENPWRYYQFEPISGFVLPAASKTAEDIDADFRTSLNAIQQFAEKQELTFYAAVFRLALFVISPQMMSGSFDADSITARAKTQDFPQELNETLSDGIFYVSKMRALEWPPARCYGLLAVSLTNVFGGMGSWNDMSFEKDAAAYDKVSADFFLARELFFASQLSAAAVAGQR